MDNIYSKFYTGEKNPFGIGTWDSNLNRRRLNHSNSQSYYLSNKSFRKNKLILPPVGSKYENGGKIFNQYPTQSSSSLSSSFHYDTKKNRNELSNYIKDINYNVANKLQNDNFIAQQKLNNLKNNYNEIKTLLNNKLEKLEHDQQMQFDNLKYALGQGGGLKMLGAVKNANGGNNYDLNLAEKEDLIDATRRLPKLLDKKINEALGYRRYTNLRNRYNESTPDLNRMKNRIDEELKRQRALDDMRFRRELDEIEAKRENIRQERQRMLQELQTPDIDELDDPLYIQAPPPQPPMYNPYPYNPYNPYMFPPPPPYYMPQTNNNNNDTGELIKIFLIKKLFDDNKQQPSYSPFPMQYPYQPLIYAQPQNNNQKLQPYNSYPLQPIFLQPANQNNNNNPQEQEKLKTKEKTSESQEGIPFVDPLEKYLNMVNKARDTGSHKKSSRGSGAEPIKLKKKKKDDDEDDDEDNEDDEEKEKDEENDEEGEKDDEGENGDEDGGEDNDEGDGEEGDDGGED